MRCPALAFRWHSDRGGPAAPRASRTCFAGIPDASTAASLPPRRRRRRRPQTSSQATAPTWSIRAMVRRSRATAHSDDGPARQIAFHRRKKLLLKKAMELSVLCDCSVGLVVFGPDGSLVQFSDDGDMGKLLEQYAEACRKPHERYTNDDLLKEYADSSRYDDMSSLSIARKRELELGEAPGMIGGSVELVGPSGQSIHVEGIKPAGFMDDGNYPLSPGSEKAHRDITTQFDQWMEVLNMRDGTQQGGGGGAGLGAAALRHKKSLSVTVPEMPTGHVFRSADDGPHADGGAVSLRGGAGGVPSAGSLSINRLGSLGMSELMGMPSPGGLFFGGDGLFTSRGGLGLDLPTPDSTSNLPLNQAGFEWPTSSRDSMLPGFSDNESGEELPGGLMVTGRGLRKRSATSPLRDGDDSPAAPAPRGDDGHVEEGMEGLLVVSGIKVSGETKPGGNGAAAPGSSSAPPDSFPGFSHQGKEPTETPMVQDAQNARNGIELPLDV